MADSARATVYLDRGLYKAVKIKAAATERSISRLVNDTLKRSLREDAEDLAAFESRSGQPKLLFEDVVKSLKRAGRI
jgi:transposase